MFLRTRLSPPLFRPPSNICCGQFRYFKTQHSLECVFEPERRWRRPAKLNQINIPSSSISARSIFHSRVSVRGVCEQFAKKLWFFISFDSNYTQLPSRLPLASLQASLSPSLRCCPFTFDQYTDKCNTRVHHREGEERWEIVWKFLAINFPRVSSVSSHVSRV